MFSKILIFALVLGCSFTIPDIFAEPTIEIILENPTFSYGERLVYTIKVSEITEQYAIIQIRDESGKSSSPIPIAITGLETPVPSLYPFESNVFPVGKYFIDAKYGAASDTAEFNLVDSGRIVIPFWIKQVAYYWISPDGISDQNYADALEFLIKNNIITIPKTQTESNSDDIDIPSWVKTSTLWWLEEKITDEEYAQAIQYLIKVGIIKIVVS